MAHVEYDRAKGVVTLTLSESEALYVAAELGGGNSYFHGVDHMAYGDTPYSALVNALDVSTGDYGRYVRENKHGLQGRFTDHLAVSRASRPRYDNEAGKEAGRKLGFLGESD